MSKRPIVMITISYILGILWGIYVKVIPLFLLSILILFIILLLRKRKRNKYIRWVKIKFPFSIIIIFFLFSNIGNFQTLRREKKYEMLYQQEEEINIVGIVASEIEEKGRIKQCEIEIIAGNGSKIYEGTKLYLQMIDTKQQNSKLEYGDLIQVKGKYKEPEIQRNRNGFDYKRYLKTKNIYGTIEVTENITKIKDKQKNFFMQFCYQIRSSIKTKVRQYMPEEIANVMIGILIGDTSEISEKIKKDFDKSNLLHILSVSGDHIGTLTIGIFFLINRMRINKKIGYFIVAIILFFFLFVAGFTPSVVRACMMGILSILANIFHRKSDIWNNLAFSLFVLLWINPFYIEHMGLQLSYLGSIGILLGNIRMTRTIENKSKNLDKIKRYIKDILKITIFAQSMIFPVLLFQFGTISTIFCISNLLVSPLMSIIILVGFLFYLISFLFGGIANILCFLLERCVRLLIQIASLCASIPFAKIYFISPGIILLFFYYLILISLLISKPKQKKRFARNIYFILILFFSIYTLNKVLPQNMKIHFVDVGQGDCTYIETRFHKRILIDGGGNYETGNYSVGEDVLLPYLLKNQIGYIDYVMISHFDMDHCRGLIPVLENIRIGKVIFAKQFVKNEEYQEIIETIKRRKIAVQLVKAGDKLNVDSNTEMEILHPKEAYSKQHKDDLNTNSIMARIKYQSEGKTIYALFTGDIEEKAEKKLIEENISLRADILKVGHHGSKTSTIEKFLEKVKPKISLIGVGKENRFGHPNKNVLDRLTKVGSDIYRTDEDGEIIIKINTKGKIKIETMIP